MTHHDDLCSHHLKSLQACPNADALEALRLELFGKSGLLTSMMKQLGGLSPEQRKSEGERLNVLKETLFSAWQERKRFFDAQALNLKLQQETLDLSLPATTQPGGRLHPITQAIQDIKAIFADFGFSVVEGPEVEDDFHNFTALNIPEEHPARQLMDTFYLPRLRDGRPLLLRTHTSSVQIRTLRASKPPLRILSLGRVFRSDFDITHTPNFHQVEGLVIEQGATMAHLKGYLMDFCRKFFAIDDLPLRFRPNYFPFTEPSAEVDIGCSRRDGTLRIGHGDDWLEVLGCGMVHPNVLKHCGLDPQEHQGFAFGMGIERLAMLKYGIPDLRAFYDADLRWLQHYGCSPFELPTGCP